MAGERPWAKELQMGSSGCPSDSMGHADIGFSSPPFFLRAKGMGPPLALTILPERLTSLLRAGIQIGSPVLSDLAAAAADWPIGFASGGVLC